MAVCALTAQCKMEISMGLWRKIVHAAGDESVLHEILSPPKNSFDLCQAGSSQVNLQKLTRKLLLIAFLGLSA